MKKTVMSVFVLVFTLAMAGAVSADDCPHHAKGEKAGEGHKCIWGHSGVEWTVTAIEGGHEAKALVPGCKGRSKAVRGAMEKQVPECKTGKCGHGGMCPFAVEGVTYEVANGAEALVVTAKGDAKAAAEFKTRMDKKIEARKSGEGCGCGGHEKKDHHHHKGEKKEGGCGCGGHK